jgi:hypothetical protein
MASIEMTVQYCGLSARKSAWTADLQDLPKERARGLGFRLLGHCL